MSDKDSFNKSLRVDAKTLAELDRISKSHRDKQKASNSNTSSGGRERGDEGSGRQGREPGYKSNHNTRVAAVKNATKTSKVANSNNRAAAVRNATAKANTGAKVSHNSPEKGVSNHK